MVYGYVVCIWLKANPQRKHKAELKFSYICFDIDKLNLFFQRVQGRVGSGLWLN